MVAIHCARGASGAPQHRCYPCQRRETPILRCRFPIRSSAVSLDSPPWSEWLPSIPPPFSLFEVVLRRGGSISLQPHSCHRTSDTTHMTATRYLGLFHGHCQAEIQRV